MPKSWKYRPELITRTEKIAMLALGTFVDLFPLVGIAWGLLEFIPNPFDNLTISILLVILTVIFILIMVYFTKSLLGNACQRCPNFSCAMNKTPPDVVEAFLKKNPKMKNAWEEAGWTTESR